MVLFPDLAEIRPDGVVDVRGLAVSCFKSACSHIIIPPVIMLYMPKVNLGRLGLEATMAFTAQGAGDSIHT